jgi:hypothetical protein
MRARSIYAGVGALCAAVCFLSYCGKDLNGPHVPVAADLVGKWNMISFKNVQTQLFHFGNSKPDSVVIEDTTIFFTNNNDYFNFYGSMTYHVQFDDNIIGNTQMVTDSGTWSFSGDTHGLHSQSMGSPIRIPTMINGKTWTFKYRLYSDSSDLVPPVPGGYLKNTTDYISTAEKE